MMLSTPVSENKTKEKQGKTQSEPETEEFRRSGGWAGHNSFSPEGGRLSTPSQQTQQWAEQAAMQKAYGNQAVLRIMVRTPEKRSVTSSPLSQGGILQRKCACGNTAGSSGTCSKCQQSEEMLLQRKTEGEERANEAPLIVHEVLNSPGQPLEPKTRAFMESRFQHDFSHVRAHTDTKATKSAKAVNALAYTVGNNVVFGKNQYTPEDIVGKRLLAHELTHVVQQGGASLSTTLSIGSPSTQQEHEADIMAKAMISNQSKQVARLPAVSNSLQRESEFEEDMQDVSIESDSEDVNVQDGDSPAGETVPVGDLSDAQIAAEDKLLSPIEETNEVADEDLANPFADSPAAEMNATTVPSKAKPPSKKTEKPKEVPWIKHIDIALDKQQITLEWSNEKKETSQTSTGKGCPNTGNDPCPQNTQNPLCTPTGENFSVAKKGGADYTNKKGDAMSWYVEFVSGRGIGIHNSQIVNGSPLSHGCVRVSQKTAKTVNQNVNNQTTISVNGKANTKAWTKEDAHKHGYTDCPNQPPKKPINKKK